MSLDYFCSFFDSSGNGIISTIPLENFQESYFYRDFSTINLLNQNPVYKSFYIKTGMNQVRNLKVEINGGEFPQNKSFGIISDNFLYNIYKKQKNSIFSPNSFSVNSYSGVNEEDRYVSWLEENIYMVANTRFSTFNQLVGGVATKNTNTKFIFSELPQFEYEKNIYKHETLESGTIIPVSCKINTQINCYDSIFQDTIYITTTYEENIGTLITPVWNIVVKTLPLRVNIDYSSLVGIVKNTTMNLFNQYPPFFGKAQDIEEFLEKNYG